MPVSESQKRAAANWNRKNLGTIGCTVSKEKAEAFKEKCKQQGLTVNSVISKFVDDYLNSPE